MLEATNRGQGKGVLILAYAFPPENIVGALRPYRFSKYLPHYGYPVQVVTASAAETNPRPDHVHYVADRGRAYGKPLWYVFAMERIIGQYLGLNFGESLLWARAALAKSEALYRSGKFSAVLSTYPPLLTHWVAQKLKRRHPELIWVADFRDPFRGNPDLAAHLEWLPKWIEGGYFAEADHLIANTDKAAEVWRNWYPQHAGKISYIFNGFDPEEKIEPLALPEGRRLIAHVGEIYNRRHPQVMLAAVTRLIRAGRLDSAQFEIQLAGTVDRNTIPSPGLLDELAAAGCLSILPPDGSPVLAARRMAGAHSLLLIDWAERNAGSQVPTKLYVYVRVGRPVLACTRRDSPVDRILKGAGTPHVALYPEDSDEAVEGKVLEFFALPTEPRKPSEWFLERFDGRRQAGLVARILEGDCVGSL